MSGLRCLQRQQIFGGATLLDSAGIDTQSATCQVSLLTLQV